MTSTPQKISLQPVLAHLFCYFHSIAIADLLELFVDSLVCWSQFDQSISREVITWPYYLCCLELLTGTISRSNRWYVTVNLEISNFLHDLCKLYECESDPSLSYIRLKMLEWYLLTHKYVRRSSLHSILLPWLLRCSSQRSAGVPLVSPRIRDLSSFYDEAVLL